MSNVATAGFARSGRLVPVALTLALAGVVGWVVAVLWADELFLVVALVGAVAAAAGVRARREVGRQGSGALLALAAIVLGGLVAAHVAAYALVWALGELA